MLMSIRPSSAISGNNVVSLCPVLGIPTVTGVSVGAASIGADTTAVSVGAAAVVGVSVGAADTGVVAALVGLASVVLTAVAVTPGGAVAAVVAVGGTGVEVGGTGVDVAAGALVAMQKYTTDVCWLLDPCTVRAHRPGNWKNSWGSTSGEKRTYPSDAAQHSGLAVPNTVPSGRVNQNDTCSPAVKLQVVKVIA